jgi:hypothetical protein
MNTNKVEQRSVDEQQQSKAKKSQGTTTKHS